MNNRIWERREKIKVVAVVITAIAISITAILSIINFIEEHQKNIEFDVNIIPLQEGEGKIFIYDYPNSDDLKDISVDVSLIVNEVTTETKNYTIPRISSGTSFYQPFKFDHKLYSSNSNYRIDVEVKAGGITKSSSIIPPWG